MSLFNLSQVSCPESGRRLQDLSRAMTADGEAAEQLSLKFVKQNGALPNVDVLWRCDFHAVQCDLEYAVKSESRCALLVCELITKVSQGAGQHGSFAHAVRHSNRLMKKFGQAVVDSLLEISTKAETLEEEAVHFLHKNKGGRMSLSSAPQLLGQGRSRLLQVLF